MTGFARGRAENESYVAEVEVRSLNHRYLDLRVRVPSGLTAEEMRIRERVASRLARGKVDVAVYVRPKGESAHEVEVDRPLLEELFQTVRSLGEDLGVPGDLRLSDLLAVPQAFRVKERNLSGQEPAWQALSSALDEVLAEHDRMRAMEGDEMAADLERRMTIIAGHLDAVEKHCASGREQKRKELAAKIEELAGALLEPAALAMEVARLVDRSDIAEEITRFRSHLSLWREAVSDEGPCGKKLDFIVQEMNREMNTIGSKCQGAGVTERVIAVKSELERVREQVQNIE
ncbi:MAG: YicC/YloC family endoribonuclease [Acidobacteriota bacterium]